MSRPPEASAEVHAAWADLAEVPSGDRWLTAAEAQVQAGLRFAKRRNDWRVGRWTAKRAVAACVGREGVEGIEILAGEDGAPIVGLAGEPTRRIALSLSHSDGRGFAAATAEPTALGCDLEAVARRTSEFIGDYLTQSERDRVLGVRDSARDAAANLVWSAKEAALKALRQGLRMDTRLVGVQFGEFPPADGGWAPLTLHGPGSEPFTGWWRRLDGYAWAVVTRGPGRPFLIESPQSPRVAD